VNKQTRKKINKTRQKPEQTRKARQMASNKSERINETK
jgi:hypothetical protein